MGNKLYSKYNVKIEDIALIYSLINNNISTTLTGIKNIEEINKLISILNNDIIISEDIFDYIKIYSKKNFINIQIL